jgi:hypothetical protein
MTTPFGAQLLKRVASWMKNDNLGNITERQSTDPCTLTPVDIFRKLNPSKRTYLGEIAPAHCHVSGTAVTLLFDIQFETIGKNTLVRFYRSKCLIVVPPDANVAAKNNSIWY